MPEYGKTLQSKAMKFQFQSLESISYNGIEEIQDSTIQKVVNNLLAQIPAEASTFYVFAMSMFTEPSKELAIIFSLVSLALLFFVRTLSKASKGVLITSAVAFLIWMAMLENGALRIVISNNGFDMGPWTAICAFLYTIIITLLANKGVLK